MVTNYEAYYENKQKKVEKLWAAAIDSKPVDFEWSSDTFPDTWEPVHPVPSSAEGCINVLVDYSIELEDISITQIEDLLSEKQFLTEIIEEAVDEGYEGEELGSTIITRFMDSASHNAPSDLDRDWLLDSMFDWDKEGVTLKYDADWDTLFDYPGDLEELQEFLTNHIFEHYPDAYVPIYNCYYPIPGYSGDPKEDQAGLSTCVLAQINKDCDSEYVLALTACGADFRWEICASYVELGYLPPYWACRDLPRMAGNKEHIGQCLLVLLAAQRTLSIVHASAAYYKEKLDSRVAESKHTLLNATVRFD